MIYLNLKILTAVINLRLRLGGACLSFIFKVKFNFLLQGTISGNSSSIISLSAMQ